MLFRAGRVVPDHLHGQVGLGNLYIAAQFIQVQFFNKRLRAVARTINEETGVDRLKDKIKGQLALRREQGCRLRARACDILRHKVLQKILALRARHLEYGSIFKVCPINCHALDVPICGRISRGFALKGHCAMSTRFVVWKEYGSENFVLCARQSAGGIHFNRRAGALFEGR